MSRKEGHWEKRMTKGPKEKQSVIRHEVPESIRPVDDSGERVVWKEQPKFPPVLDHREFRPPISRSELKQRARDLRYAAEELEKSLDGDPAALARRTRDLLRCFKALENVITGSMDSEKPGYGALPKADPVRAREMACAAKEVAGSLLSKNFTNSTLREAVGEVVGPSPSKDKPLPGEWKVAVAVDVTSYVTLDYSNTEAVTRQAASEWARNSGPGTKLAVSTAQYLLGVSPLKLGNDVTKMLGEAVRGSNAKSLKANMAVLAKAGESSSKLEKWRPRELVLPPSPPPLIGWHPTLNPVRPETALSLPELSDPEEPLDRGLRGPGI